MTPFASLHQVVNTTISKQNPISPFLSEVIVIFNRWHIYYRTYNFSKILSQSNETDSVVYGIGLQILTEFSFTSNTLVNIALTFKCAEDLLSEYRKLSDYQQQLSDAFNGTFPLARPMKQKKKIPSFTLFSASFITYIDVQVRDFFEVKWIICCLVIQTLWQCFVISMSLCDAYLLLQGDRRSHTEACTELMIRWQNYKKDLENEQGSLQEALKNSQELIDQILENVRAPPYFRMKAFLTQMDDAMHNSSSQRGMLNDIVQAGKETARMFYQPGKILPFQHRPSENQLSPDVVFNFPFYGGQEIVDSKEKSSD